MTGVKDILKNVFRSCGLMPFNPSAIDNNILQKRKSTKHEEISKLDDTDKHLKMFEASLSKSKLQNFNNCSIKKVWTGEVEDLGLFKFWLQLIKKSSGNNFL